MSGPLVDHCLVDHAGHYERRTGKVAPPDVNFSVGSAVSILVPHHSTTSMEDRMRFLPSRSRTRWLIVSGTAAACVAVVTTGALSADAGERPAAGRPAAVAPSFGPSDAPAPDPRPDDGNPVEPLGDLIRTGIATNGGEVVLYGVPVDDKALPDTTFGLMAGVTGRGGDPTNRVMSNEYDGSDKAPGFHAVQGAMNVEGDDTPTFGYYSGPATRITSGRITAKQAAWSEDSSIVVFWFAPNDVPKGFKADDLKAFDAAGRQLPAGNDTVGVG
jgi:hypothetical protein